MNIPALLWILFSATATITAIALPVNLFAWLMGYASAATLTSIWFNIYMFIILSAALFHGLYRTKTILHDLGIKSEKTIAALLSLIFLFFGYVGAYIFIFGA